MELAFVDMASNMTVDSQDNVLYVRLVAAALIVQPCKEVTAICKKNFRLVHRDDAGSPTGRHDFHHVHRCMRHKNCSIIVPRR